MRDSMHQSDRDSWEDTSQTSRRSRHHGLGSFLLGLSILTAGLLLTLDNFGVVEAERYIDLWPVILIFVGLSHLTRPAVSRRVGSGLIWIAVGSILLLDNLGVITFDVWDLWPLFLVVIGLNILSRGFRRGRRRRLEDPSSSFSATAVMGADVRRITAQDFRGGDATAIMGGCEIDLRGAGSEGGPAEIDCFAMWGGIEIWVPEDWEVRMNVTALLAGSEDKTQRSGGAGAKVLIIRGTALMAGIEVKN